jgi:hypothetical protein
VSDAGTGGTSSDDGTGGTGSDAGTGGTETDAGTGGTGSDDGGGGTVGAVEADCMCAAAISGICRIAAGVGRSVMLGEIKRRISERRASERAAQRCCVVSSLTAEGSAVGVGWAKDGTNCSDF